MTHILTSTKVIISALLLLAVVAVSTPVTHAQEAVPTPATETSLGEMETLIKQLMEQVKSLQAQLQELQKRPGMNVGTDKKASPMMNKKEMDVEVLENLRVRSEAGIGTAMLAVKQRGMKGMVIEGPVERGGMQWYKIKYSDGTEGWSAGQWLRFSDRVKEINAEMKEKREDYKDAHAEALKERKENFEKAKQEQKDQVKPPVTLDPVMCTMDAFQCPNGEFVGRSGPKCQFMCPVNETATTTQ